MPRPGAGGGADPPGRVPPLAPLAKLVPVPNPECVDGDGVVALLRHERVKTCELVADWIAQQRRTYEVHAAQQERFLHSLLDAHRQTLAGLVERPTFSSVDKEDVLACGLGQPPRKEAKSEWLCDGGGQTKPPTDDAAPTLKDEGRAPEPPAKEEPSAGKAEGQSGAPAESTSAPGVIDVEALSKSEELVTWWRRCSGLHTVSKWVQNYKKHPAGWAALLMIHGVPEITGRLRSKVENYAIYSALFLSMSIALLVDPPDMIAEPCSDDQVALDWWVCHIRMRAYLYAFAVGTASHTLCIMLAMSFVNALNEAARDSDVFRMFARGKGFLATVKCQMCFRVGCMADFAAVTIGVSYYIGWEAVVGTAILAWACFRQLKRTSDPLFNSASIVRYWREELGGCPDKDDPYDLDIPIAAFRECVSLNEEFCNKRGKSLRITGAGPQGAAQEAEGQHTNGPAQSAVVAALF